MKIGIITYPGTNCEQDVFHVLKNVLGVDTKFIWYAEKDLNEYDGIVVPGGFSYGDYLRAGAIAARMPITSALKEHIKKGKPVLSICNGFQILVESGLLLGALMPNIGARFICKWVTLRVETSFTALTNQIPKGKLLRMPIAHAEGDYYAEPKVLRKMDANDQIVFRYVDERGNPTPEANPNGSIDNIAGISNEEGNVVALMPHPERASEKILGSEDGRAVFESMVKYIEGLT